MTATEKFTKYCAPKPALGKAIRTVGVVSSTTGEIGPGAYEHPQHKSITWTLPKAGRRPNSAMDGASGGKEGRMVFFENLRRGHHRSISADSPGPGAYDPKPVTIKKEFSMSSRIETTVAWPSPGPAHYDVKTLKPHLPSGPTWSMPKSERFKLPRHFDDHDVVSDQLQGGGGGGGGLSRRSSSSASASSLCLSESQQTANEERRHRIKELTKEAVALKRRQLELKRELMTALKEQNRARIQQISADKMQVQRDLAATEKERTAVIVAKRKAPSLLST